MRFAALFIVLLLSACAGHIETRSFNPRTGQIDSNRPAIPGVIVYGPQYMKVTHAFTTRVDKEGNVLGTADQQTCTPVIQKEEVQIMPDFANGFVVRQTGGFLTANKLSVTLTNGMLTTINAESAPQTAEILKAASTVLETIGVPFVEAVGEGVGACNAGPRVVAFARIEPVN